MSERASFLIAYAEKKLGRALSKDEADLVSLETSRRKVADLCATFSKPKSKPKTKAKKEEKPIDKIIEEVVKDEE